jgi:hypothetical protein
MMNKLARLFILLAIGFLSACGGGDSGVLTGMENLNPPQSVVTSTPSKGVEFASASQKNVTTSGGYKVSASFGNKTPTVVATTASNYKVYLSVEGEIASP